tara:strand:- start:11 stop:544 length:534 start_codon:yes stop_codon:yes gene_type:complete
MTTTITGAAGINRVADGADMPAGSVINVYRATSTGVASGAVNGTWYDSTVSITFTPTSASSTFVVWYNVGVDENDTSGDGGSSIRLKRVHNGVTLYPTTLSTDRFSGTGRHAWSYTNGNPTSTNVFKLATVHGYDLETHTTAAITYTVQFASYNRNNMVVGNPYNSQPLITVMEIAG